MHRPSYSSPFAPPNLLSRSVTFFSMYIQYLIVVCRVNCNCSIVNIFGVICCLLLFCSSTCYEIFETLVKEWSMCSRKVGWRVPKLNQERTSAESTIHSHISLCVQRKTYPFPLHIREILGTLATTSKQYHTCQTSRLRLGPGRSLSPVRLALSFALICKSRKFERPICRCSEQCHITPESREALH